MKVITIESQTKVELSRYDPRDTGGFGNGKEAARQEVAALVARLGELQERLYAERKRALLVVLQGMDTSGKDGVVRTVFDGVNPQGVRVASFKAPTPEELGHDFLWRVHARAPARGEIVIFNRSHYEDVLVTRVHGMIGDKEAERRFAAIRAFEAQLASQGTAILKFFLHIGPGEQAERLRERLEDPAKNWKFDPADLEERKRWKEYQAAYGQAIGETATAEAPWIVVPADRKWYRDLVIATALVEALEGMRIADPPPLPDAANYLKLLDAGA